MKLARLDMAAEAPLPSLEGYPDASENYAVVGYDAKTKVGFFAHLGRWSLNREMWREQLYVYLPDRSVLAYRGYGLGETSLGPAAAIQRQQCLEPGKLWSIQHSGPTLHLDARQLVRGPALEPVVQRVDFDIRFRGDLAPFFYPSSDNTTWGHWHYEQVGSMSGSVKFAGATYEIEGFAFRDHTRGPRKLEHFCGSNWIQGTLPDGTGFALFQTWQKDGDRTGPGLQEFTLTTADAIESATLLEAPALESLDDLNAPIRIVFESPSRGRVEIKGEPLNTMIFSSSSRHEILLGAARGSAPLVVAEQPMLLSIAGQNTVGHSERCRLLSGDGPLLKYL